MKKRFILLEDVSASSSVDCHPSLSSMVDYSGAAPGGLLFAVYFSPGGNGGIFSSCSNQGLVASPGAIALESGVCSFSGNVGIEICWLEQAWAIAKHSAKAAGFVVLLGVGGVLCYHWLYSMHRKRNLSGRRTSLYPFTIEMEQQGDCEEMEEDLFDLFEVDISVGLNCLSGDHRPKRKIGKGVYIADQIRTRWRHVPRRNKQTQEVEYHPQPLHQSYSIPDGLVKFNEPHSLHKFAQNERFLVRQSNESFSGFSSHEASPSHACRIRSYSLSVKDQYLQSEGSSWSFWDSSVESFISGTDCSETSRLIREYSVDSDCSDFSLDIPFSESCNSNTLEVIERIEQEINSVKNNCLAMNHELYTLHDVHPSGITSGESEMDLSSITMELAPLHMSQSSFKGMLNLTSIPDEISDVASNASDFSPSRMQLALVSGSDEDGISMEWDNRDLQSSVLDEESKPSEEVLVFTDPVVPAPSQSLVLYKSGNLLDVQTISPQWCSQESGYLEWEGTPGSDVSTSFTTGSILSPLQEKRENDSMSCTTTSSYSSCLTSPDDSSHEDSIGVVKRRQWAKASQQNRDSAISDLGLDLEAAWREEAVGITVLLHHYAQDTWQAPTPRAQTIKQAYIELERMTECRRMRKMRGDNYGILRAALCQMVMKRIPIPRASEAIDSISRELAHGGDWIRQWTFGHRLPYGPNNVLQGMRLCLETLDRLMEEMEKETDPLEALVSRLNADLVLDTQLMEALKLHMLNAALNLQLTDSLGDALPLFALGLFARPDSKNVKELTINYLNPIGDSATLQRAEYYLLGFALHARIDVYRPTTTNLDGQDNVDLRTSYPDFESFSNLISIIEEDERHYSVPVP
ncbi:uncharacterized protein LOC130694896 [Daphnia carinata]|uniref:uncharacterized protein LOC130694896 n=1 Tax=Daphnia carinata TaxID=120202 RepID=UPI00257FCA63|nr:uncharacterized protein LOC130694896 [Daphnia carinata]XP_057373988.1 uncharacterized protein LOC130694896 [Daphnia carinata]XP_059351127.1 uncharacterized protein LOC130694896 [Daphnia carinata]XP_059351128.1 uncharacterized protein LOC130694896 [Daphnia carinata]